MNDIVRITLEAPYYEDPTQDLVLRFGQEARIPLTDVDQNGNPLTVGWAQGAIQPNVARNIEYRLNFADESRRSAVVPIGCAYLYFGDWTLKPGKEVPLKLSFGAERNRVAMKWGGFRLGSKKDGPDYRIIGAPNVPKVRIEALDSNAQASGSAIYPEKFWDFESSVDKFAKAEYERQDQSILSAPQTSGNFDLSKLSADDVIKLKELFGLGTQKVAK